MTLDICFLSVIEMAARIRRGQLSAREVVDAHLTQIERVNPKVNAIVAVTAEEAIEKARKADEAQIQAQAGGESLRPLH